MSKSSSDRRHRIEIEYVLTAAITPDPRNARKHDKKQITKLGANIRRFSFTNPILIDEEQRVIAGDARLKAAIELQMAEVPCIRLHGLTEPEKIALGIADNKLGDMSAFDPERLTILLAELEIADFEIEYTGFDTAEVDVLFGGGTGVQKPRIDPDDEMALLDPDIPIVTRPGDLWHLGKSRLLCGNALDEESYRLLLGSEQAAMVFADMPYNVSIATHASGLGKKQHGEFAMASGEMSRPEFISFLTTAMTHMANFSIDGSIHYQCIDWAHAYEMLVAGQAAYAQVKAICVWNKGTGGMGSLYRSQHELVFVFKNGTAPHVNNVELGRHGRYRTNVWDYPGLNSFGSGRDESLAAHPTVKPVALVADTMRDCSKRGALVLDPFVGSGTTIIAAERANRRAAAMELDPRYVDVAVRRWEARTGLVATHAESGQSFAQVAIERETPAA